MKLTRITALLLASLLLASCSTAGGNETATGSADASGDELIVDTAELSEMEKRALMEDDLPEKDFGGADFRISTKRGTMYEIDEEEETGDIIEDALYARNRRIEERFNVKIVPVITEAGDGTTHVNEVRQSIMAADDAFDLSATYVFTSGPLVTDGCFLNWLNMPYNDLSKPWWIGGVNEKFRVGDAIYAATGDMCVSTLKLTYGVFYNRTRGADYDLNDTIYDEIRAGKWTIDRFIEITRDIYTDVNGDGTRDGGDFYGFTAEKATNLDVYTFAFDIPMVTTDEDGMPELVINTPKTIEAVEKVNKLYWDGTGSYIPDDYSEPIHMFRNGNALFTTTYLTNAFSTFRDMTDDYSILPYPKWDEAQEKYMTGAMDNYSVLGIPVTVTDVEMASLITESLNIESYKTLFPTYYEQALQSKYARDAESIEMIDILMAGRNFDFCTLFSSTISGIPFMVRELVASKSTAFASKYQSKEKAALKAIEQIVKAYEDNADT
ncbi:MAG: hypothetical protein E7604_12070 [Ruminococcaceae bacterium]|nr:hypothetical protein [Oscillospiraceae bacterium]